MRLFSFLLMLSLAGAMLLLTSCETSEQKRPPARPPVEAQAPSLNQPSVPPLPPPPRVVQPQPGPKPDPVEALIAAADKEFEAGRANYSAGHLEAAKANFDRAFDMLLQTPFDVRANDRLQREFDKIVEGVNQLELLALKEGDGFSEQRAEPAPIDEANEVTFPVDPNIRAKAEAELKTTQSDLPLTLNDAVAAYINYFSTRGRASLERGYVRSGRYREMILKTLKEEGVPQDLIYLAQAESGFHPLALSRAGARGMWQFMAGRGLQYGLSRTWWLDERQDPVKATRAAARHLKDLYSEFGDWYLVMAAYNSGPGTVQRAVERTGYADYWELYRRGVLPAETRNYVPIILAITIMSKNPSQYGLERLRPDAPLPVETVTLNHPVDLRLAAECADTSVAVLQELNPSLLRLTTPKEPGFELRLPAGTKEKFQKAIAAIPVEMRVAWRYHRVVNGDTLAGIARKYHTTAKAIADVNGLEGDDLRLQAKLIIPITPGRRDAEAATESRSTTRYRVRKGDTARSVADRFGVSVENLRQWNHLQGSHLPAGRVLTIHLRVAPLEGEQKKRGKAAASAPRRGRQLSSKSRKNNNIELSEKRAGKRQAFRAKGGRQPASKDRRLVHKVKRGETLTSIADAYNVSIAELRRNNRHLASNLHAGEVLVIRRGE
jgi:membrane-bound lytic murein transglycosylase D